VSAESEIRKAAYEQEKKWKNTGKEAVKLKDVNIGVSAESASSNTNKRRTGRTLARKLATT
jgi:hypothetical protein